MAAFAAKLNELCALKMTTLESYDALPYESVPISDTHPDYLRAVASTYGFDATPLSRARVLELGCADGGNLIPLAWYWPGAQCVGIDLGEQHVADGNALIKKLGLKNAQILHHSISDDLANLGAFDYILVHGVYSWVPDAVCRQILEICAKQLTQNGIAYISYNTLPGWHTRALMRDALLAYAGEGSPAERLARAHQLFMLMESAQTHNGAEAELMRNEIAFLRRASAHYVFHEYLEEFNQPVLFRDFAADAAAAGLSYLCDAQSWPSGDTVEAPDERIEHEQLQDIVSLRKFRRSLLIQSSSDFVPHWRAEQLTRLSFYADLNSEEEIDLAAATEQIFTTSHGTPIRVNEPLVKAALMLLALRYPRALSWIELVEQAQALVCEHGAAQFARAEGPFYAEWVKLLSEQALRCAIEPVEIAESLPARPKAHALARAQAQRGTLAASIRHSAVELDEVGLAILRSLDGTKNLDELAELAAAQFESDGNPLDPELLRDACERTLWLFQRHGLIERRESIEPRP